MPPRSESSKLEITKPQQAHLNDGRSRNLFAGLQHPSRSEITEPQQAQPDDGSNRNLCAEVERSPGSRAYLTRGGSDGHPGDRRTVNTGDPDPLISDSKLQRIFPKAKISTLSEITEPKKLLFNDISSRNLFAEVERFSDRERTVNSSDRYPLMPDSSSELLHSFLGRESLTPGNDLDRLRQEIAEVKSELKTERNNLNNAQSTFAMNWEREELKNWNIRDAKSAITNLESKLETLNSKEIRLRMAELPAQVEAHQKTLVTVEQTLATTAQKGDELKNWQFSDAGNVLNFLNSHLEVSNEIHTIIEKLTSMESLITEKYDTLYSKIKELKDNATRNAALEAVYYIDDHKQENKALQTKAKTYGGEIDKVFTEKYNEFLEQSKKRS